MALGAGAAAWPFAARAQPPAAPVIGFLNSASPEPWAHLVASFRKGLNEAGFVEGRNVAIEYRWAEGRYEELPALAADLVDRPVTVLAAMGGPPAALAAKAATATIPVVFVTSDAVRIGLVASLSRPDGNLTGVAMLTSAMEPKRLEVLQELVPAAARLAALLNPENGLAPSQIRDLQEVSRHIGWPVEILYASTDPELEAAFAASSAGGRPIAASAVTGRFTNSAASVGSAS